MTSNGIRKKEKNVLLLGFVSLLTDVSSEMIYPVLPLFMTAVLGLDRAFIGIVEGAAEATASITKLISGWLSDRLPKRKPSIIGGYGLSALAKPLLALVTSGYGILSVRFIDRLGKGIRTSPRDALLAESTTVARRGMAFGLHRAMDTAGAVLGPAAAFFILSSGAGYRALFLWSFLPAAAALFFFFGVREHQGRTAPHLQRMRSPSKGGLGAPFCIFLAACTIFTLGNSSDAFIILRARDMGVPDGFIPVLWIVQNIVYALVATPAGYLSDHLGRKKTVIFGLAVYGSVYGGFALAGQARDAWLLMAAYGVYYGFTEGGFRAIVADLIPPSHLGLAYGLYHFLTGISLLPASVLLGMIWEKWGHQTAFLTGASLAMTAALMMLAVRTAPAAGAREDKGP